MATASQVYLESVPVTEFGLKFIGFVLAGLKQPTHPRLYWKRLDQWYCTELTTAPNYPLFEVIGKGDGYQIYLYKVSYPVGLPLGDTIDADAADYYARRYASTTRGDWNSASDRDWFDCPQLCGGPMYDRCTSNTYVSWLLQKVGLKLPAPSGSVGWNSKPQFPGPTMSTPLYE